LEARETLEGWKADWGVIKSGTHGQKITPRLKVELDYKSAVKVKQVA